MILGVSPVGLSLSHTKCVIEILLGDRKIYRDLYRVSLADIIELGGKSLPADSTNLDYVINYMVEKLGADENLIKDLKVKYSRLLFDLDPEKIPSLYVSTPITDDEMRKYVGGSLARAWNRGRLSDSEWALVRQELIRHVSLKSTEKYEDGSESMTGWIRQSASFFLKNVGEDLRNSLTSSGLNQETNGDDYTAMSRVTETVSPNAEDLEGFGSLAHTIYRLTDYLYRHNGEVYYDLFSEYKYRKLEEYVQMASDIVCGKRKGMLTLVPQDINFVVNVGKAENSREYAMSKKEARTEILFPFNALLTGDKGVQQLPNIIREAEALNESLEQSSRGGDGKAVYNTPGKKLKTRLTNIEINEIIYEAYVALKKLVDYCKDSGISVFTIKSKVFRNPIWSLKFDTLQEYMEWGSIVEETLETEETLPEHNLGEIPSNDSIYNSYLSKLNQVGNIKFSAIRELVEMETSLGGRSKRDELRSAIDVEPFRLEYNRVPLKMEVGSVKGSVLLLRPLFTMVNPYLLKYLRKFEELEMVRRASFGWEVLMTPDNDNLDTLIKMELKKAGLEQTLTLYDSLMATLGVPSGAMRLFNLLRFQSIVMCFRRMVEMLFHMFCETEEGDPIIIGHEFAVFLELVKISDLLELPEEVETLDDLQFLEQFNLDYYVVGELMSEEEENFMIRIVNFLLQDVYKDFIQYLRTLRETIYEKYSKDIELDVLPDEQLKASLRSASVSMVHIRYSDLIETREYKSRVSEYTVDKDTGFYLHEGKFVGKNILGKTKYLHSKGYWVSSDGKSNNCEEAGLTGIWAIP